MTHVLALSVLVAVSAAPAPGEYRREGLTGTLTIVKGKERGPMTFSLEAFGANAHECAMEGTIEKSTAVVKDADETRCEIDIAVSKGALTLGAKNEACKHWCGARAWVDGKYLSPLPACSDAKVKEARQQFKLHADARDWKPAKKALEPLVGLCAAHIARFELAAIRNDYALTLHQLGDDAGCLKALEPLKVFSGAVEPAFELELSRVNKATESSLKACGAN